MEITTKPGWDLGEGDLIGNSLYLALHLNSIHPPPPWPTPVKIPVSYDEAMLFNACAGFTEKGTKNRLHALLDDPRMLKIALNSRQWPTNLGFRTYSMIHLMMFVASDKSREWELCRLLDFSKEQDVKYIPMFHNKWFSEACARGNFHVCKAFLEAYPQCIDSQHFYRKPIDSAIGWSRIDKGKILMLLLDYGADPNGRHRNVYSHHGGSLRQAITLGSKEALECLLYYGATLKQSGALQTAVAYNWVSGLDLLLEHGADVNEILDPDANDFGGAVLANVTDTPLHQAVISNRRGAAIWLLDNGADIAYQNLRGETAYDLTWKLNNLELLQILGYYANKAMKAKKVEAARAREAVETESKNATQLTSQTDHENEEQAENDIEDDRSGVDVENSPATHGDEAEEDIKDGHESTIELSLDTHDQGPPRKKARIN